MSTTPTMPVADPEDNPFLESQRSSSSQPTQPTVSREVTLRNVAAPVLQRPRSGPHSPVRRRRQSVNIPAPAPAAAASATAASAASDDDQPSCDEDDAVRPARRGAHDVWKFYSAIHRLSNKRTCLLCM